MLTPAAAEQLAQIHAKLKQIRESKTVSLNPTPMLRTEIRNFSGDLEPLKVRYYQTQGICHFLLMKRMVLGDATGVGKSLTSLGALTYIWLKEPDNKAIVVTPKAALRQWASEIDRFTVGITVYLVEGSLPERERIYRAWAAHTGDTKALLIVNYHLLVRDWDFGGGMERPDPKAKPVYRRGLVNGLTHEMPGLMCIFDEAQAFKTTSTKTWGVVQQLSERAHRCYGLTATLLKNHLMEGFAIYKALVPWVFSTKTKFMEEFCVTKLQTVAGGRKVPIVVGYKNLNVFRERIDPYFLGRQKHEIATELPVLITKEITCELSPAEDAKYTEALDGVIELGDGELKEYEEAKALVSLVYCQKVVDSLSLLRFEEGAEVLTGVFRDEAAPVSKLGSKEAALMDLLTEELEDEKVIIYTRFESHVARLVDLCREAGIKAVRITGKEASQARKDAQDAFQDLKSDTRVVIITDAGSEAINLQAASALVFYNSPWSWGNYVQTLGRPVRIGSVHSHVVVYHIVAERPGREKAKDRKTIDHHVLTLLRSKKNLIDQVLGQAAVGALTFDKGGSSAKELIRKLQGQEP